MRQLPTCAVLALFAAIIAPATASAQMTVLINSPLGTPPNQRTGTIQLTGMTGWPLNRAECEANLPITFNFTNVPVAATTSNFVFAVWRAAVSSSCNTGAMRATTMGTTPRCMPVSVMENNITGTTETLTVGAADLFGGISACAASSQTTQEIWFLVVTSVTDTNDTMAGYYVSVTITLDTQAPTAPVVTGGAGDAQIPVEWTNPSGETLYGANVYVDTAGCDMDGNVTSTTLVAGAPAPSGGQLVTGATITRTTLDGTALGLTDGDYAAVAVTLIDRARNESLLSNVVCIQKVPVTGFWDAYCTERGLTVDQCTQRYGCAAGPAGSGRSGGGAALAIVAAIALAVRRRRR